MNQIITSLLDNDAYKVLSMGQLFYHQRSPWTRWAYKNRDADTRKFTKEMVNEIKKQIQFYCQLEFKKEEIDYLRTISWISNDYIDFLTIWHPKFEHFTKIELDKDDQLVLEFEGPQLLVSPYETPVMAIISEVYFKYALTPDKYAAAKESLYGFTKEKIDKLKNETYNIGVFSDFGTRRRFSKETFQKIVELYATANIGNNKFIGTSNVEMAMKLGIKPCGTMAHEIIQSYQAIEGLDPAYTNREVMKAWHKEFGLKNGIYLTDCLTTDLFLKDFTEIEANLFDGVRHDSGDPYKWGDKMIAHYEKLGINPKEKTLLFSDSLDFGRATSLNLYFKDKAKVAFGIGTYLVNDNTVAKAMNQVLKVVEVDHKPVAKISDTEGKIMCRDPEYIDYLKRCINWRLTH